jgi:hypothetical protein
MQSKGHYPYGLGVETTAILALTTLGSRFSDLFGKHDDEDLASIIRMMFDFRQ